MVEAELSMNPKKSELEAVVGFWVCPNSTKPSSFVGIVISCFGIRTTPRFWSSRTSIIRFFFLLNNMELIGDVFI